MADYTSLITIQKGKSLPPLNQCTSCCRKFHCPFCSPSSFKPTRLDKLNMHIKNHFHRAVLHEGFTIHRCSLGCRPSLHYHCLYCLTTVLRRNDFENHLLICKPKQHHVVVTEPPVTSASVTAPSVSAAEVSNPPVRGARLIVPPVRDVRFGGSLVRPSRLDIPLMRRTRVGVPPVASLRAGVTPVTSVRVCAVPVTSVKVGVPLVTGVKDGTPPVTNVKVDAPPVTSMSACVPSVTSAGISITPVTGMRDSPPLVKSRRVCVPLVTSARMGTPSVTKAGIVALSATSAGICAPLATSAGIGVPFGSSAGICALSATKGGVCVPLLTSGGICVPLETGAGIGSPLTTSAGIAAPLASSAGIAAPLATSAEIAAPSAGIAAPLATSAGIAALSAEIAAPLATSAEISAPLAASARIDSPLATSAGIVSPLATSAGIALPLTASARIGSPLATSAGIVSPLATSGGIVAPLATSAGIVAPLATSAGIVAPLANNAGTYAPLATSAGNGALLVTSIGTCAPPISIPTSTTPPVLEMQQPTTVYTGRVRVRAVIRKNCPFCNKLMNKCNLEKHIERKHKEETIQDINATYHLTSECVDKINGIFAVLKTFKGHSLPLHVQCRTSGEDHITLCESSECQVNIKLTQKSGLVSYPCRHIKSVSYCTSSATAVPLAEEVLAEVVKAKWLSEENMKNCLTRQRLANTNKVPLSVHTTTGIPQRKKCISVYEPTVSLGRVMVVHDSELNTWHCACSKMRHCVHKYVAKWHLFQTHRELFREVHSTEEMQDLHMDEEQSTEGTDDWDISDNNSSYPPKGVRLENMVTYVLQNKKIPPVPPEDLRIPSLDKTYPKALFPDETMCQRCPSVVPLSTPILITQKAKILTNWCIIEDVSTYCKQCPQCGMFYRYQEWKDKLHNFSDHILLDIPLCLTLRNLLKVHTPVSKAVDFLQLTTGAEFPPSETVLHAYLHFEALTDHEYRYPCATSGDSPLLVIMDLHKKGVFHLSESDIQEPTENCGEEINLERFWEGVSKEMIGQGFVSRKYN